MDTPVNYFGSEDYYRFVRLNGEIFAVEEQLQKLGPEYAETKRALYRARIELGHAETFVRGQWARGERS